jgi:GTP:adenosylcobinamide-phosphate guanylyltransferase
VNAVITAGGTIDGQYAHRAGTTIKALAPVRGTTMLDMAIDAAYGAGATRVAVVGGDAVAAACASRVDKVVAQSNDGGRNLQLALAAWPADERLLLLTSDMPYITADALRAFAENSPPDVFAMALSAYDAFMRRFPNAPPFGIALAGERVVNGGAFAIPVGAAPRIAAVAVQFFDARKSPWKMARLLGLSMIVRYVTGRLSIEGLERYGTARLGVPTRALRDAAPELAFDADLLGEFTYACEHD